MQQTCKQCQTIFFVTEEDISLYEKIVPTFKGIKYPIPLPSHCPDCREQRRICFRNERKLYERKCDYSKQDILSVYAPDSLVKVYEQDIWWSDCWDPLEYGRDFDFNKSFFEQFYALTLEVPKIALMISKSENCRYTNNIVGCKNCYMLLGWGNQCEDCYYGKALESCKNCVDTSFSYRSELCYECVNVDDCYSSAYLTSCMQCSECYFSENCIACKNCFGCLNLNHKEFHIFNEPYGKEEYFEKIKELINFSGESLNIIAKNLQKLKQQVPQKYYHGTNIENCTGDYIRSSKNVHCSFDVSSSEGIRYINDCHELKDSIDACKSSRGSLLRECISVTGQNCAFMALSWNSSEMLYCQECFNNCSNCFGCVGLRHKEYCILNKQYTKEQYETLVPRIITHMQTTKEWGEFFPIAISPFAYNETLAQEYYPLTQEEVLKRGWKWREKDHKEYQLQTYVVPKNIADVSEEICQQILACELCSKNFRIVKPELAFYKQLGLPIPSKCPDCRHEVRNGHKNPRKLWRRNCAHCNTKIETSYSPTGPDVIYCESCYLQSQT